MHTTSLFGIFLFIQLVLSLNIFLPDSEVLIMYTLDKQKRDLFKKLHIKSETEITKQYNDDQSSFKSVYIHKNYYDLNGNQTRHEFYKDSIISTPNFETDFVTDDSGNVLEAYQKGELIATQEFDEMGNMIELENYDRDGEIHWSYDYEYDEEGNITLKLQYYYGVLSDTNECNVYEYISIGDKKLIKSKTSLIANPKYDFTEAKEIYEYDSQGRLISKISKRYSDKTDFEKYVDYASLKGYVNYYDSDGKLWLIDSLQINTKGDIVVRRIYDGNRFLKETVSFEYDSLGNLLVVDRFASGSYEIEEWNKIPNHSRYEYLYNELKQKIEVRGFINGNLNYHEIYLYNDNGLLLEHKNNGKELRSYIYEYYE